MSATKRPRASPSGIAVVSAPGFHRAGTSICTQIPKLLVGASRTYHLTMRAGLNVSGRMTNRATVTSNNAPVIRSRATVRVNRPPTPPQAGLGGLG